MKRTMKFLTALLCIVFIATAFVPGVNPELAIGAAIPKPDVKMMDIKGKALSLAEIKKEKGLLVIFSCNTCPYVKLYADRIQQSITLAEKLGIGVAIINSNEAQRTDEDSFEEMKKYAADQHYACAYTVDKNAELADAFGATRTPQCFLFGKTGLAYRGAIDDNVKDANAATAHYLNDALTAVAAGKQVTVNSTKSVGCTIKRIE